MGVCFRLQYLNWPLMKDHSICVLSVWLPYLRKHSWWQCYLSSAPGSTHYHHLTFFPTAGRMNSSWPQYPEATALLSNILLPVHNFSANQCELWRRNGLYNYAWINWFASWFTILKWVKLFDWGNQRVCVLKWSWKFLPEQEAMWNIFVIFWNGVRMWFFFFHKKTFYKKKMCQDSYFMYNAKDFYSTCCELYNTCSQFLYWNAS